MLRKILALLVVLSFVVACTKPKPKPVSLEDTPQHHYLQGMELIEQGSLKEAESRFDRAIYLDEDYARAYAGKSLVHAMLVDKQVDKEHAKVEVEKALELLERAVKKAKEDTDRFAVYVTAIRVYTNAHPEYWLDKAKEYFDKAVSLDEMDETGLLYYQSKAAAYYFMGVAYYKAYAFRSAEEMLAKVLSMKPGKWHDKADKLYKKVQKIVRASAEYTLTDIARRIAVKDKVGRGDVAALLVDELHLDKFFAGRIPVSSQQPKADFIPADVVNHMFKKEIMTVLKWHIRGLEPQYDETTRLIYLSQMNP